MESELEIKILKEYRRVLVYCQTHPVPDYMLEISRQWAEENLWKEYWEIIQATPYDYDGKVVVDFGCKYGHLLPMFMALGAKVAIGVEVEKNYIEPALELFHEMYSDIKIVRSEEGYIPLQPETVDFVLLNEVISHVNPAFLETVYAEIGRILKPGGMVLVSDGNNIGYGPRADGLIYLWDAWENGPDGAKTSRDTVIKSYLTRRKEIICARHPQLDKAQVDYLAENTSGLWGAFLLKTIDEYAVSGALIRRTYRRGACPTNPNASGVMMERGFYPLQVIRALESYGFDAQDIHSAPANMHTAEMRRIIPLFLRETLRLIKCYVFNKPYTNSSGSLFGGEQACASANLTIVGTKRLAG